MPATHCRAKNPATCRYHGRQTVIMLPQPGTKPRTASPMPDRVVKTGAEINTMFKFANRLKGGYVRAKHQRPRNLKADSFMWTKPGGGLWISTRNEDGVSSWDELWGEGTAPKGYLERTIAFTPEAKVLLIDSLQDYRAILDRYPHYVTFSQYDVTHAKQMGDLLSGSMSAINPDGTSKRGIDFERLAQDYDAIILSEKGLYSCGRQDFRGHMDGDISLYLWDIESGFVLNRDAINVT